MGFEVTPLRVALVVEGKTDLVVLRAIIEKLSGTRPVVLTHLQPEYSATFDSVGDGEIPGGWSRVYRWCRTHAVLNGPKGIEDNLLFLNQDVLILQLDGDVAKTNYRAGHIDDSTADLPCDQPCPPIDATLQALRVVVLRWLGGGTCPDNLVLCFPSQNLEAWLVAGLYPGEQHLKRGDLECLPAPENILAARPKSERLLSGGKKDFEKYRDRASEWVANWSVVKKMCSQAQRFEDDFMRAAVQPAPTFMA